MTIERVRVLIQQINKNLEGVEDRGLNDGTDRAILQAQMALGGRRALEELERKINAEILATQLNLPLSFIERKQVSNFTGETKEKRKGRTAA